MHLIKKWIEKESQFNQYKASDYIPSSNDNCTIIQYEIETLFLDDLKEIESNLMQLKSIIGFIRTKSHDTDENIIGYKYTIILFLSTCGLNLIEKKAIAKGITERFKGTVIDILEIPKNYIEDYYINPVDAYTIYPKQKSEKEIKELFLNCFIEVKSKPKKGKEEESYIIGYQFDQLRFYELWNDLGYHLYNNQIRNEKSRIQKSDICLIEISNKSADIIDPPAVKKRFVEIINKYKSHDIELGLFSSLHRKEWTKVASSLFYLDNISNTLPTHPNIGFDVNENAVYAVYSDCVIKVKNGNFEVLGLNDLDFTIWKSTIKRDVLQIPIPMLGIDLNSKDNIYNNDIAKHCENVSKAGRDNEEDADYSFKVFQTTLGYLCTPYKDMANAKAVIFQDLQISYNGERNGSTGKSLLSQSVINFCPTVSRNADLKNDRFALSGVGIDTEVFIDPEVRKDFDFNEWLEYVTGKWTVEKKGKDAKEIPFSHSPKLLFITNQTIPGGDISTKRRKHVLEFGKFYPKGNEPNIYFGRNLFSNQWSLNEWQKYHCFMLNCIKEFQKNGLLEPKLINSDTRELIESTDQTFIEFMEIELEEGNGQFIFSEFYEKFRAFDGGVNCQVTSKKFGSWIRNFFTKKEDYSHNTKRLKDGASLHKYTKKEETI